MLSESHVTDLSVAFEGTITAERLLVSPFLSVAVSSEITTEVTGSRTVTVHSAPMLSSSLEQAVITAVPEVARAVTTPFSTVATA